MARLPVSILSTLILVSCGFAPDDSEVSAKWIEPGTGMAFIEVKPGGFVMGSPPDEPGREGQERQHTVTLSRPFWLGAFEVTQHQWEVVMGTNPSWFRTDDRSRPVENVTWFEVQEFLRRLTKRVKGSRFRLPTEAEWEYACRAHTTTAYSTGPVLHETDANFATSPDTTATGHAQTMRVGSFPANPWGFHDMHGNVWEWTEDEDCPYRGDSMIDPVPVCGSSLKVIRGGSWSFGADSARCALRYTHRPQDRGFSLGFRAVREPHNSERGAG
jgi:formylglycine-generating enzyme required for sulfatase activity